MTTTANFEFTQNIILEDDRVLLRPLELFDLDNLVEFSLNEPEIWTYSLLPMNGKEDLKNYIQLTLDAKNEKKEFPFIVYDKLQKKYAGSTRFYDIQILNKSLQLGYTWYGKQFHGTGLNKHCKFLLLEFAFETMKIERVEFRADNNNERSKAAMKSIGCTVEGVLRKNLLLPNGSRRDSIVLSILKDEWYSKVREELKSKL